jgi:transglutaminase-like putative cysteine protease
MSRQCIRAAGCAIGLTAIVATAAQTVAIEPEIVETRTVTLRQTVTLSDIPGGSKLVRLWVPMPSDGAWQRVVNRRVVSAPGSWRLEKQSDGRGEFVYVEAPALGASNATVVVECEVQTQGVYFPLDQAGASPEIQPSLFAEDLAIDAPLMESDSRVREIADKVCGNERDPAKQALLLQQAVAAMADHYSKDPSKPKCGRGAAGDCLEHGGGCCTDLHSLFIALARARNLPARIQYGYRLLDAKAETSYDPGYRCWVEYYVPGAGWVPTDVVASDNADAANPRRWSSLSSQRVWLWEGRSFELTPKNAAGPVHTMICGWAEIDGKPVDVLPAADGSPSKLARTVEFKVLSSERADGALKLPE